MCPADIRCGDRGTAWVASRCVFLFVHKKRVACRSSAGRPVHCAALGAGSELVVLVFEQDVERGEGSVTARDILLQVELIRIAQFVARVHLLLETSQIIPNHDGLLASTAVHRQEYAALDGHRPPLQKNAIAAIVMLYVIHV
jgi:hypothetical protein